MWGSLGWGQIEELGARTERIMIQSQEAIQRLGGRGSMKSGNESGGVIEQRL